MRAKSGALLVLALGCGLVASLGITQVMARRGGDPSAAPAETQPIMVAVKDIPAGTALTAQLVRAEEWPKGKVPAGAIFRHEDLDGRRAKQAIYADEAILEKKLVGKDPSDQWADSLIKKGYRVASVRVDPVAIHGGLLRPGSRVDLLIYAQGNGLTMPTAKTVLQDLRVFAVNDVLGVENGSTAEAKSIQGRTVSLLVTPDQAEVVTAAGEMGSVRLILRSPDDDEKTTTRGITPSEVLGVHDGGNRAKENEGSVKDQGKDGFGEYLKSIQRKMADAQEPPPTEETPPAAAPAQQEHWSMQVFRGSERNNVDLVRSAPTGTPEAENGPWAINGPGLPPIAKPVPESHDSSVPLPNGQPATSKDSAPPSKKDAKAGQDGSSLGIRTAT